MGGGVGSRRGVPIEDEVVCRGPCPSLHLLLLGPKLERTPKTLLLTFRLHCSFLDVTPPVPGCFKPCFSAVRFSHRYTLTCAVPAYQNHTRDPTRTRGVPTDTSSSRTRAPEPPKQTPAPKYDSSTPVNLSETSSPPESEIEAVEAPVPVSAPTRLTRVTPPAQTTPKPSPLAGARTPKPWPTFFSVCRCKLTSEGEEQQSVSHLNLQCMRNSDKSLTKLFSVELLLLCLHYLALHPRFCSVSSDSETTVMLLARGHDAPLASQLALLLYSLWGRLHHDKGKHFPRNIQSLSATPLSALTLYIHTPSSIVTRGITWQGFAQPEQRRC